LHRDLKPSNLIVTATGAKLLDFGLAKVIRPGPDAATAQTIEGTILGTSGYMAPEQVQGKVLDERADIFSLGAVLYEMLSGRRAFVGQSLVDVLTAIVRDDPQSLESPAASIVARCLSKQPAQRFQTMAELRAALERLMERTPTKSEPSIAVLPFANLSADKENEYFSDGLAEEVLNLLAQVSGLKVIARTSSFAFRDKGQDIRRIAEALDVLTILEGSVRRSGTRIRVTAQLISAVDGSHLWSERYDRELTDVFVLQDEIAQSITAALLGRLVAPQVSRTRYEPHVQAYEAYLKALHHKNRFSPESLVRMKACLEEAMALDPHFALAHAEMAAYFYMIAVVGIRRPQEAMPQVRDWALKALTLDERLPDAHRLLGEVAMNYDYDWHEAARRFQLAMAHEPVPVLVRLGYARYLHLTGRTGEALEQIVLAVRQDPLQLLLRLILAAFLQYADRVDEALAETRAMLELDERFVAAHLAEGAMRVMRGEFPEALVSAERAYAIAPMAPIAMGLLAGVLIRLGERVRAGELLQRMQAIPMQVANGFVMFHQMCGETDQAIEWALKVVEERDPNASMMILMNRRSWANHKRWPALVRALRLPEPLNAPET
jgi:serine/threonine-protein kinase